MTFLPHDRERAVTGSRRYTIDIPAPFNARLKTRLERAVTQAILNPSRALPTLRRAVITATEELRALGYADARINDVFTTLIEDVVRGRALEARSVVSGRPRWMDLCERVIAWTSETGVTSDGSP